MKFIITTHDRTINLVANVDNAIITLIYALPMPDLAKSDITKKDCNGDEMSR